MQPILFIKKSNIVPHSKPMSLLRIEYPHSTTYQFIDYDVYLTAKNAPHNLLKTLLGINISNELKKHILQHKTVTLKRNVCLFYNKTYTLQLVNK